MGSWFNEALIGGGNWNNGANCGCRAVNVMNNGVWNVNTNNGVRLACDLAYIPSTSTAHPTGCAA